MREDRKDIFLRWFASVLVASIFVGGLCFAWPTYQRGKSLKRKEAELDRQIVAKQAEIDKIEEYSRRFRSDRDFIEAIARQNRRVYPGEIVFIFEDDK